MDQAGRHVQDQEDQVHRQAELLKYLQAELHHHLQLCQEDEPFWNGELK